MSLMSSPGLPRTHSRPYTPLKYLPQGQEPADSQPSMQSKAQRSQHTVTTNALWQSSAQMLAGKEVHTDHLTISSDSRNFSSEQHVSSKQGISQTGERSDRSPPADSRGRRPSHHGRKQQSAEVSAPSSEAAALQAEHINGHKAYAAPAQSILHCHPPYAEQTGMPGGGHSIDWVPEPGVALPGQDQDQCSAHSVAQLQSDLQHAQAAELHYLVRSCACLRSLPEPVFRGLSPLAHAFLVLASCWFAHGKVYSQIHLVMAAVDCVLWVYPSNSQPSMQFEAVFIRRHCFCRAPLHGCLPGWRAALPKKAFSSRGCISWRHPTAVSSQVATQPALPRVGAGRAGLGSCCRCAQQQAETLWFRATVLVSRVCSMRAACRLRER